MRRREEGRRTLLSDNASKKIYILSVLLTTQKLALLYKESPHKTVKWESGRQKSKTPSDVKLY